MRVLLKLVLDCDAETAWRVIRSPAGLRQVSSPLMVFSSLEPGGFPELWGAGEHPVRVSGGGLVPLGEQVIVIGFPPPRGDARLVRDTGYGVSGIFPVVRRWRHTMAVAPRPDGRTLYRDELSFEAGWMTVPMWPVYWAFWQWRAFRMTRLAPSW
jgi:hypothetical protein